jgi:hypothetical protein
MIETVVTVGLFGALILWLLWPRWAPTSWLKSARAYFIRKGFENSEQLVAAELNRRNWWWGRVGPFDADGWWRRAQPPAVDSDARTPRSLWLALAVAALIGAALCGPMVIP